MIFNQVLSNKTIVKMDTCNFSKDFSQCKTYVGVIHQRHPGKNWLFGPPPVWPRPLEDPPHPRTSPPSSNVRPVTRENATYFAIRITVDGGRGVSSESETQNICPKSWVVDDLFRCRPHPPSGVVRFWLTSPPSGRTSLMNGPVQLAVTNNPYILQVNKFIQNKYPLSRQRRYMNNDLRKLFIQLYKCIVWQNIQTWYYLHS